MRLESREQEAMYYLLLTRRFEEKTVEVFQERDIPETPHSSIGQEAVGVGGCLPLKEDDMVLPSLRTRAALLVREVPLREIVAGMFATASGPSDGRTTAHHMGSAEHGVVGTTSLVASHLNPGVGTALANSVLGNNGVTVIFFGDGACQRGEFHTATNFAANYDLPVIFIIENNLYTEVTPLEDVVYVDNLIEFLGDDIDKHIVDGQDINAVMETTEAAAKQAREGGGPTVIEAETFSFRPHAEHFREIRPSKQIEKWRDRDPMELYREHLTSSGIMDNADIEELDQEIQAEVEDAFAFKDKDSRPEESALDKVYKTTQIDLEWGTVV